MFIYLFKAKEKNRKIPYDWATKIGLEVLYFCKVIDVVAFAFLSVANASCLEIPSCHVN